MTTNNPPTKAKKRRGGNYCVAFGCTNCSGFSGGLFTFPKDPIRRRQWVLEVQNTRLDFVDTYRKWMSICGAHFTADQFDPSVDRQIAMGFRSRKLGRKLLPTAVPTEFVSTYALPGLTSGSVALAHPTSSEEEIESCEIMIGVPTWSPRILTQEANVEKTVAIISSQEKPISFIKSEPYAELALFENDPLSEELLEVSLQVDEGLTYTAPNHLTQDFACQFPGIKTQNSSCQFPENSLLSSEIVQTSTKPVTTSENLDSNRFRKECLSIETEDLKPGDQDD